VVLPPTCIMWLQAWEPHADLWLLPSLHERTAGSRRRAARLAWRQLASTVSSEPWMPSCHGEHLDANLHRLLIIELPVFRRKVCIHAISCPSCRPATAFPSCSPRRSHAAAAAFLIRLLTAAEHLSLCNASPLTVAILMLCLRVHAGRDLRASQPRTCRAFKQAHTSLFQC
jgi:hypothetical protein